MPKSAEPPAMISCILLGLLGGPHLMLGILCTAFGCQRGSCSCLRYGIFLPCSCIVTAHKAPALSMASIAAWRLSDWRQRRLRTCCQDACAVATAKISFQDIPLTLHLMHQPRTHPQSVHYFNALGILSRSTAATRSIALHTYRICMQVLQAKGILSFP